MLKDLSAYTDELVAHRRHLHKIPEEGWTEFQTTAYIVDVLEKLGLSPRVGQEVIDPATVMGRDPTLVEKALQDARAAGVDEALLARMGGYTGAVVDIKGMLPGPVTACRFDIDCVCVTESEDPSHEPAACGFASTREGLMHSCGHDSHTAIGLTLAHWLKAHQETLKGCVRLIFQPAEEGVRGAAAMVAKGVVDDVDCLVSSHVGCEFAPGEVGVLTRGFLATTKLDIEFTGRPAHAGSDPQKGRSALMAACAAAMSLNGISRHGEGDSRIAIGRLNAGEGRNVVPAHAFMQTEVRGANANVNDFMTQSVYRIVRGMAEAYEVEAVITKAGEATSMVTDESVRTMLLEAAQSLSCVKKATLFETLRGSEDASMLMRRVQEQGGSAGFFVWGCRHNGHHRPDFDIQDAQTLPVGFGVFAGFLSRMNGIA